MFIHSSATASTFAARCDAFLRELGMDPTQATVDVDAVKASLLVPPEVENLTFRDLQERRRTILKRMGEARPRR